MRLVMLRKGKIKATSAHCSLGMVVSSFYQLTEQEPDVAPSAKISKFNDQFPNPRASSTASD